MKTYHGFNVGDKVVRIPGFEYAGRTGTVIERGGVPDFVYIRWDNYSHIFGSFPDRLRLIDGTDYEEDGDGF